MSDVNEIIYDFNGQLLKSKRKEKGLTQKQLEELCGINEVQIRRYESNRVKPKMDNLEKLALALNVSEYELMKVSDDCLNNQIDTDDISIISIGEKIRYYRKQKGLTQKQLGKKCDIVYQQIGHYEQGRYKPSKDTLKKIANALNIPVYIFLDDSVFINEHKENYKSISEENVYLKEQIFQLQELIDQAQEIINKINRYTNE